MAQQLVLPEEELTRKASAIKTLSLGLLITVAISAFITIVLWVFNRDYPVILAGLSLVGMAAVGSVSYWLVRVGKVRFAGYFFIVCVTLGVAVIVSLLGGFAGPVAIAYLFPILIAGITISINASFWVATVVAFLYLGMAWLERNSLLPEVIMSQVEETGMLQLAVAVRVVFFYFAAFLSWLAASRLYQALQSVRHYVAELQTANEKLKAGEEELRVSNEELRATEEELRASNEELEAANEELRETQEQLIRSEKLAAIGQLAGGVGHELRNPLGAIKNAIYYVKGKVAKSELARKEPRVMEFLEITEDEINSSNKIISDLLGFSRVGKPAVSFTRVKKMIDEAISRVPIPENIELAERLGTDRAEVEVDSDQIQQVLVNVITNSVQAMPGGGKLTIAAREKGRFLEVEITDTGVGIPRENVGRVFEPLFTTRAKGIGLGLAVCKSIIDRHGGDIEVRSKVGEGTTFKITLPLKQPD